MSTEWFVPHALTVAELGLAVLLGYGFGRGVRKELHREIAGLRVEIKAREELLATRSKREDKMIQACMERLGVAVADDSATNERVDLSRPAVAVAMEEDRRRRTREENRQSWEEQFEGRRAEAFAEIS